MPRRHMALGEGHPQAEMFRKHREVADKHAEERRFLCFVTVIVGTMWAGFFGMLAYNEWKVNQPQFAWELQSVWLNP